MGVGDESDTVHLVFSRDDEWFIILIVQYTINHMMIHGLRQQPSWKLRIGIMAPAKGNQDWKLKIPQCQCLHHSLDFTVLSAICATMKSMLTCYIHGC